MSVSGRVGDGVMDFVFVNGILDVYSEEEAEAIRRVDGFGSAIREVKRSHSETIRTEGNVPRQGTKTTVSGDRKEMAVRAGSGWFKYQGKSYRRKDLPAGVEIGE
jgi:hypothetical protein